METFQRSTLKGGPEAAWAWACLVIVLTILDLSHLSANAGGTGFTPYQLIFPPDVITNAGGGGVGDVDKYCGGTGFDIAVPSLTTSVGCQLGSTEPFMSYEFKSQVDLATTLQGRLGRVIGPNGREIATTVTDLLAGNIKTSLTDAGIDCSGSGGLFFTGSTTSAVLDASASCIEGFSSLVNTSSSISAAVGSCSATSLQLFRSTTIPCSAVLFPLCICQFNVPDTGTPTTSPSASPITSPTTSPSTSRPTASPIISPTTSPSTSRPTASPIVSPTTSPTTTRPTTSPVISPTSSPDAKVYKVCKPQYNLPRRRCKRRVRSCSINGIAMKWTGPGCLDKNGQRLRDGGCQCEGYCGYACRRACNADPTCTWRNDENRCYSLDGTPGAEIPKCLSRAPDLDG